jgi:hypothetical protein
MPTECRSFALRNRIGLICREADTRLGVRRSDSDAICRAKNGPSRTHPLGWDRFFWETSWVRSFTSPEYQRSRIPSNLRSLPPATSEIVAQLFFSRRQLRRGDCFCGLKSVNKILRMRHLCLPCQNRPDRSMVGRMGARSSR